MTATDWQFCLLALPGHWALWIWLTNQVHAAAAARWHNGMARLREAMLLAAPLALAWQLLACRLAPEWTLPPAACPGTSALSWLSAGYGWLCLAVVLGPLPVWIARRLTARPSHRLLDDTVTVRHLDDGAPQRGWLERVLLACPGNESLELHVHRKLLCLPTLPPALAGLSIVHLSDLHLTGRIGCAYYEQVVDEALALRGDLIVLTGDLVENVDCLEWFDRTLARLRAPLGVYFVLGNHDARIDHRLTRRRLIDAGLIHLGGRWTTRRVRGETLLLAGNERPWFGRLPYLDGGPGRNASSRLLRIALAHTPDQIDWARRYRFDLLLAGHTHGGQIQLPGFGPILAPSRYNVRFAAGTFYEAPTLMHVSRGIAGELPLRLGAPPELALLTLHATEVAVRPLARAA